MVLTSCLTGVGLTGLTTGALAWLCDFVGGWVSVKLRPKPEPKQSSLTGQVVVVTGGAGGIGRRTVLKLAQSGATVVVCDLPRQLASLELPKGLKIETMELDLASLASIQRFAKEFEERYQQLNILVLNAGIAKSMLGSGGFRLTPDGFEEMVGINFLGHFYLTHLLLPRLRAVHSARIIANCSSASANSYSWGIDPGTWRERARDFKDWKQYGQSKLALLLFTRQLQHREPSILCLACHPGMVGGTGLLGGRASLVEKIYVFLVYGMMAVQEADGGLNTIYLATAEAKELTPGGFYFPVGREVSWPWSGPSHALQRAGLLQSPFPAQRTEYSNLWSEAEEALRGAGAQGL